MEWRFQGEYFCHDLELYNTFSNLVGLIVFNSINGGALFLKHLTDTDRYGIEGTLRHSINHKANGIPYGIPYKAHHTKQGEST